MNIRHINIKTNKPARVNDHDIAIMRMLRFNGFTLQDIANFTGYSVYTTWNKTADVFNKRWMKDRSIKKTGKVYLLNARKLTA